VWADYITELAGDPIVSAAHHVEAVAAVVLGESSHSASSSIEVKHSDVILQRTHD
jgi:hypothetical protein